MNSYLYILGRTPELAFLELKTFLPDVVLIRPDVAKSDHFISIEKLGGTVKIAEVVDAPIIEEKSTFGVSVYPGPQLSIKELDQMKKQYGAARFVATRGEPLTSVVIKKNKLQEFIFVNTLVGKTLAVQDFESWSKRDFDRPYADPKAGMLPPKVARMVVNLAGIGTGKTLLDPFCGMGTILGEAGLMEWKIIGSDMLSEVARKAEANIKWLGLTGYELYVSDATHISEHIRAGSVDAIVTEPFMGNPLIIHHSSDIKNIMKGLEKLYIGCLRDWHKVLKPDGVVVIALPQYAINGKTYFVKKVIDMCGLLGYTIQAGPIEYGRPGAIVTRQFYIFKKL